VLWDDRVKPSSQRDCPENSGKKSITVLYATVKRLVPEPPALVSVFVFKH